MMSRSARPGHNRDSATAPLLTRAVIDRTKRLITSIEMRLG
jgi:hypothetical protein